MRQSPHVWGHRPSFSVGGVKQPYSDHRKPQALAKDTRLHEIVSELELVDDEESYILRKHL